jgi:hypothetical protein
VSVLNVTTDIVGKTIVDTDHGIENGIEFLRLTADDGTVYDVRPLAMLTRFGARMTDQGDAVVDRLELSCVKRRP